ncbi:MAG TPA: magnesium/cobalt transporter CorA [Chloroflexota bacterium]|nr:magnesium/cobalt transporter CorA [Chloroflexota bacterium]
MGKTQLLVGQQGQAWRQAPDVEQISDLLGDRANLLWLDISDPGPADLELLRREFGFHELALEDVARAHQRPKCDTYRGYYFIVVYAATRSADRFLPTELQIFWGESYVVTIHRGALPLIDEARTRWAAHEGDRPEGMGFLVYTLLDALVDGYFPLMDWVAEQVDDLEESIFVRADNTVLSDLFQLRKELLRMRRLLAPTRDVLNEIVRRDLPLFPEAMHPYFADVYDHSLRVLDSLDVYRDLLASALDLHLSAVSNRLNQLVKRMTALTLIVMAPTLVAGIYGMNFKDPWPSYDEPWGFAYSMALMAVLIVGGLILARRADWL